MKIISMQTNLKDCGINDIITKRSNGSRQYKSTININSVKQIQILGWVRFTTQINFDGKVMNFFSHLFICKISKDAGIILTDNQ